MVMCQLKHRDKLMMLISTWDELKEVADSDTHMLKIENGCGWIIDKSKPDECGEYLSTHTFYGKTYEYSTRLLQQHGFDVMLANWDA